MRRLVLEGRSDPLVQRYAVGVVAANPTLHPADAVFRHAQSMPYAYDEAILAKRGVDGDTSELLQGAPYQVTKILAGGVGANVGDCDDRAILVQSLLEAVGYPTRFVLVRGPGRSDFSHVYSEVLLDGGNGWVPLDTIMDGRGGRPFLSAGEEIGAPIARDRTTVAVDPRFAETAGGLGPILLAALAWCFLRR